MVGLLVALARDADPGEYPAPPTVAPTSPASARDVALQEPASRDPGWLARLLSDAQYDAPATATACPTGKPPRPSCARASSTTPARASSCSPQRRPRHRPRRRGRPGGTPQGPRGGNRAGQPPGAAGRRASPATSRRVQPGHRRRADRSRRRTGGASARRSTSASPCLASMPRPACRHDRPRRPRASYAHRHAPRKGRQPTTPAARTTALRPPIAPYAFNWQTQPAARHPRSRSPNGGVEPLMWTQPQSNKGLYAA